MARRKVTKTARIRYPRTISIWDQFPKETQVRIIDHCTENNLNTLVFIKKAVYAALPVKYKVDKEFVMPFGKYTGETAESVQEMDPDYISWACRNIQGFELETDMKPTAPIVNAAAPTTFLSIDPHYYRYMLNADEFLDWNRTEKVWAKTRFSNKYRFLGRFDAELFYRR
jgi:hypothetical protein